MKDTFLEHLLNLHRHGLAFFVIERLSHVQLCIIMYNNISVCVLARV